MSKSPRTTTRSWLSCTSIISFEFRHDGQRVVVAKIPEHSVPDASTSVFADSLVRVRWSTRQKPLMWKSFFFCLPLTIAVLSLATRFQQRRVIRSSDGCNSDGQR